MLTSCTFTAADAAITGYNMTVKSGPASSEVSVFVTPTGTGSSTVQFSQFNFVVGFTSSCLASYGTPSATPSLSSYITSNFGNYTLTTNKNGNTVVINGTSYVVFEYSYNQNGSNTVSMSVGTEYQIARVSFSGSWPGFNCTVSLLDDGTNSTTNSYIADATVGSGTYYTPQYSNMDFYSGSAGGSFGSSTLNYNSGNNGAKTTVDANVVLPVRLEGFSGDFNTDCEAVLHWQASEAINFSHFEIEYSRDAVDFIVLGTVPGDKTMGTASAWYDYRCASGNGYYRLKMVDINGGFRYSGIIKLHSACNSGGLPEINIYPNPLAAGTAATLRYEMQRPGTMLMILRDDCGREVTKRQLSYIKGINTYVFETEQLGAGVYILIIADGINKTTTEHRSLIVQ